MHIRPATAHDARALVPLLATLGYATDADAVARRLARLAAYPGPAVVLVAAADEGHALLGVVTAHAFPAIHHDAIVAWLTALAVADDAQGRGVGRGLVGAAEEWARAQGAVRISVTSGTQRAGAHAFYERLGYDTTGRRFSRALARG